MTGFIGQKHGIPGSMNFDSVGQLLIALDNFRQLSTAFDSFRRLSTTFGSIRQQSTTIDRVIGVYVYAEY